MRKLPLAAQMDEIDRTDAVLAGYDGRACHPFRPPRGRLPVNLLLHFARIGRAVAFWSYDSHDYEQLPASELLPRIQAKPPESGDTILMHDDNAETVALLANLLPRWRADGFDVRAMPGGRA